MTPTTQKPKIEAIYPLNSAQQGLLFHHLMEGVDHGFLQVQYNITGNLDIDLLKKSWEQVIKRHEVLRTSVHWKKLERPMMIVRPEKEISWTTLNWAHKTEKEIQQELQLFQENRKTNGTNLEKNPLTVFTLIQKSDHNYYLFWDCHHLLLDGWSSTIIINEVFIIYKALKENISPKLEILPSYKSYTNWLNQLPVNEAESFWKKTFEDFSSPTLFPEPTSQNAEILLTKHITHLPATLTNDIKNVAKKYKVTLNSLLQGVWSLLLYSFFKTPDITFGNTVSGRSIPFPNIESMAGMFSNVLPVRVKINEEEPFKNLVNSLQKQLQAARNFEYSKNEQITSWIHQEEGAILFNNLFVFENFPWETLEGAAIKIADFQSGITSTYPVTAIFKIENGIEYNLLVNSSVITNEVVQWFLNTYAIILKKLVKNTETTIQETLLDITSITNNFKPQQNLHDKEEHEYIPPKNKLELKLVKIWEQVFGINLIGIQDNFFQLGGKSFLSIKICTLIEKELGIKLPPTILLENATIESLANVINQKEKQLDSNWKYLVPIKVKGKKAPLFCIHAGGGHVFFYKPLADAVDTQRPVYALQPMGIFGKKQMHQNIEQMAIDYANEILSAQPKGTINIVVYCFSTAVGLEIAGHLKTQGRKTNLIVADTLAEHSLLLNKDRFALRLKTFLQRVAKNPFTAFKNMIGYRIAFYLNPIKINLLGSEAEKNTERMRKHLVNLFNNYTWKNKIDDISLIITDKINEEFNTEIYNSWKPLVTNEIRVQRCTSNHITFFDFPDVETSAKSLEKAIIEN